MSTCKYALYKLVNYYYSYYDHYSDRLKELFQLKNGLTTSLLVFFFLKNAKNLGWSDDAKRRKKREWPKLTSFVKVFPGE